MFGPGEHDDLRVVAVERRVVGHEAAVAEARSTTGWRPSRIDDAVAVVDYGPDVAVARRRLGQGAEDVELRDVRATACRPSPAAASWAQT